MTYLNRNGFLSEWTFNICDECKKYSGHENLAYAINRLHEFYKNKGVTIAMWCEKLLDITSVLGAGQVAGGERSRTDGFGMSWYVPPTKEAIGMIPKDVLLIDWLYPHSWDEQVTVGENGFKSIYGNFEGWMIYNWNKRKEFGSILGAEVSTWCLNDEYTLGHDGKLVNFWGSSKMLWDKNFDENLFDEYIEIARNEFPYLRELLVGRRTAAASRKDAKLLYVSDKGENLMAGNSLPERGIFKNLKQNLPAEIPGIPVGENEIIIPVHDKVKSLSFVHTCFGTGEFKISYRLGIKEWSPIVYAVRYVDNTSILVGARFGIEIGNIKMDFGRKIYEAKGFIGDEPTLYNWNQAWAANLLYAASPFYFGDGETKNCAYVMDWVNPKPDVAIERIHAVNNVRSKDQQVLLYFVTSEI